MRLYVPFVFSGLYRILCLLGVRLKIRAALVFLLMITQSLLESGFIYTLTSLGMALTNAEGLRQNFLYQWLFAVSPKLDEWTIIPQNLLMLAGAVVVVVSLSKNLVNYLCTCSIALLGEDISLEIGDEIMRRYFYMDYVWHLSPDSGNTFQIMLWRGHLGTMLTHLLSIYAYLLTIIILFLYIVGQEPELTLMVLGITGTVGIALYALLKRKVDQTASAMADNELKINHIFMCATQGIREVLLYRRQKVFLKMITDTTLDGRMPRVFTNIAASLPTWILEATGFLVVVLSIAFMARVQYADIPRISAALALLLLTAWRVLPFCNRIVSLQIAVRGLLPMAGAVLSLLEKLRITPTSVAPEPDFDFSFQSDIELKNISFRYPSSNEDNLHHICLKLRKGEKVGLIGPSGAGKSTLAGILGGLLPPKDGQILLDGCPLTPEGAAALSMRTGFVPQRTFLFAGTLAENISFSTLGDPIDEQRLSNACRQAAIDFAYTHPKGLQQQVGENGSNLSGGQAQRVAIARALYTNPQLLIFDEATSSLDKANENAIRQTLDNLSTGITCVIIAHRLSTVEHCDKLVWLDNGHVIMEGSPAHILREYEQQIDKYLRNA